MSLRTLPADALATPHPGHHLFVAGPPGSGRRALVRQAVQAHLREGGAARSDWLKQGWAPTGPVDQAGCAQAEGGVNEKIEGFFDLCAARGLDGTQRVLIPAANAQHLMLREDVATAVAAGRFGVACVDSVNGCVVRRLHNFARLRRGEPRALKRPLSVRQVLHVSGTGEP